MKNTAEVCPAAGGAKPPKSIVRNLKQYKKGGENLFPSMRLTIFVLHMYKQLTSEQRYTISVLLQKKMTLSFIAETIKVSVSTVSSEIKRNSSGKGTYSASAAARKSRIRKSSLPGNRSITPQIRSVVFWLIRNEQWSPEQVSGRLRNEQGIKVSKSTIYNWIKKCSPHYKTIYTGIFAMADERRKGITRWKRCLFSTGKPSTNVLLRIMEWL